MNIKKHDLKKNVLEIWDYRGFYAWIKIIGVRIEPSSTSEKLSIEGLMEITAARSLLFLTKSVECILLYMKIHFEIDNEICISLVDAHHIKGSKLSVASRGLHIDPKESIGNIDTLFLFIRSWWTSVNPAPTEQKFAQSKFKKDRRRTTLKRQGSTLVLRDEECKNVVT